MEVAWDDERQVWCGHAAIDGVGRVEVVIAPEEDVEPDVAQSYAEFALSRLAPRLPEARRYAAHRLVEYYNCYHAHLPDGEQVTDAAFADRLRLEGIRFRGEGKACLDWGHDLYRGDRLMAGGLVVVEAAADGRFRRAYWMAEPDAQEARQSRRCRASGEQYEQITIAELSGARGMVRVTLLGTPVLRSIRSGAHKPIETVKVDDGEGGWECVTPVVFLSTEVMFRCGSYTMKLKEYLPRLIYQCRDCQRRLPEEPSEPHRFEFDTSPLDLPKFRVILDAPAIACPGCGRHNVLWSDEMSAQIEGALTEAMGSLPTPGG